MMCPKQLGTFCEAWYLEVGVGEAQFVHKVFSYFEAQGRAGHRQIDDDDGFHYTNTPSHE